jgi:hypothetical protein
MKALLLSLAIFSTVFCAADNTNALKAVRQPFTVEFIYKPEATNETFHLYLTRDLKRKIEVSTVALTNLISLEPLEDGYYSYLFEAENDKRAGDYGAYVTTKLNGIESDPSNEVTLNIIEPMPRMNQKFLETYQLDEYTIVYYHEGMLLYEYDPVWNQWNWIVDAYNPHITKEGKDKVWTVIQQ